MSHNRVPPSNGAPANASGSYFEQQRDLLVGDIAQSLETVLQNINKLNRSLEEVISVGNEFSPVEALWSQFENVMAKDPDTAGDVRKEGDGEEGEGEGETEAGRDQTEVDEEEDVTEAVEK